MADTTTAHYSFTLPEVGGSPDTWGTKINTNWTSLDGALNSLSAGTLKRASNLGDLTNVAAARTNLGLGDAATRNIGAASNTVAAGDDSRFASAAQKAANLGDLASAGQARTNLGLGAAATMSVGTSAGTVAGGDDGRITGAAQKAQNLQDLTNVSQAPANLGLGPLATATSVPVAQGGTGATDAAGARTNLNLGAVENKSSATIRSELTRDNVNAALGKAAARVNAGSGTNAGLISWGTAAPAGLAEGEIYLRHS